MLGKGLAPPLGAGDELLLIDPPADTSHFVLPERTAVLFTNGAADRPAPAGTARVETRPGGTAHIRVGEHLMDLHTLGFHTLVHLPAAALLCSGTFGSRALPPRLTPGSDARDEIEALRLAARLVREGRVRLLIPHAGEPEQDPVAMMERLADDLSYIHALRRDAYSLDGTDGTVGASAASLPAARLAGEGREIHAANVRVLRDFLGSGSN